MPARYRVVFDLDDTLYPERAFAWGGFRAAGEWARRRYGVGGVADRMWEMLVGGRLGALFKASLEEFAPGHSEAELAEFIDAYRRHEPALSLYSDAEDALAHFASLGPIGLITDGTDWVQRRKVAALRLDDRFAKIIYTFALGGRDFHKPNPTAFELMQAELGSGEARLVYVGDNPAKDFVAPNALGWVSVQVRRGETIHDTQAPPPEGGAPQLCLDSLVDLADALSAF